jgi:hypothetical protein
MFKFPEPDRTAEIAAEKAAKAKAKAVSSFDKLLPTIAPLIEPPGRAMLAPHEIRAIVGDAHNAFTLGAEFVPDPEKVPTIGELIWPFFAQLGFDELIAPILNLRSELEIAAIDRAEAAALDASPITLNHALACPSCGNPWEDHWFRRDSWERQHMGCKCGATFELQGLLKAA